MSNLEVNVKIRKLRMALGLSQMKLAEKIGVSFQQVQKYESGANKVSLEKLEKIAKALNISFDYFITGRKNRKRDNDDTQWNEPNG